MTNRLPLYERLAREVGIGGRPTGRRVTLDERRDRRFADGCSMCGRTDVSLWQPELGGPVFCPDHEPDDDSEDDR